MDNGGTLVEFAFREGKTVGTAMHGNSVGEARWLTAASTAARPKEGTPSFLLGLKIEPSSTWIWS